MASLLVRIGPIPRPGGVCQAGTAEGRARRLSFYTIAAADRCLCRTAAKPDNRSTAPSVRDIKPEYRAPGGGILRKHSVNPFQPGSLGGVEFLSEASVERVEVDVLDG